MGKNKVVAIFTVFLCFILFVAMKPGDDPVILVRIASITAALVFVGMIFYTHFLWRVSPFNKLHKVIDVSGKWCGTMEFEDGSAYKVDAVIIQHLDDIKLKIRTGSFLNDSLVSKMSFDNQGTKLYAIYKSKPNGKLDSKNQIDYGTFILNCDEDYLDGLFFSSGKLIGRVELYRK